MEYIAAAIVTCTIVIALLIDKIHTDRCNLKLILEQSKQKSKSDE